MDYPEALRYLHSFFDTEKRLHEIANRTHYHLERERWLLSKLGNPQERYMCVHIAGTKGKGSTAAMIERVLRSAGYRTGLYTQPHLLLYRERIQINGQLIEEEELAGLVSEIEPVVNEYAQASTLGNFSMYEIGTALALLHFARQEVQYAVLEVGLGGRLDATNVVTPQVAVITSISYDHMQILGTTLTEIAGEKAGIIKPGVPVVSSPQTAEALAVIAQVCQERGVPLTLVGRDYHYRAIGSNGERQQFAVTGPHGNYDLLEVALLGRHQLENATTALATLEVLAQQGAQLGLEHLQEGFREVYWPGRLEIISKDPLVIADGAHNADSAQKLVRALGENFAYERIIFVVGLNADKDLRGFMAAIVPVAAMIMLTRAANPRAAGISSMQNEIEQVAPGPVVLLSAPTVEEALLHTLRFAQPNDLICVTGSLFVVGEALLAIHEAKAKLPPRPAEQPPTWEEEEKTQPYKGEERFSI